MPRVAVLLQLAHDIIGYGKAVLVGQSLLQPAHDLAGTDQGEGKFGTDWNIS